MKLSTITVDISGQLISPDKEVIIGICTNLDNKAFKTFVNLSFALQNEVIDYQFKTHNLGWVYEV